MKLSPFVITCLVFAAYAAGKSADDYFHDASNKYVAGRQQEAEVDAEEGLRAYPGDAHLKALDELLKQMDKQQRKDENQSGGQDQKDQQNKQDSKNGNGQDKPNPDQKQDQNKDQNKNGKQDQKKDQGKSPQDSSKQDQQKQPPEDQPNSGKGDSAKGKENQGQEQPKPGEMSKDEADRLLNSFQDEEKKEQRDRQISHRKNVEVEQDW